MQFSETVLPGAWVIDIEPIEDERGFFARSWSRDAFRERGLDDRLEQCNISFNTRRGTLRGMHYQVSPHEEVKIVRCTAGAIYDVIVDLRPDSPTFTRWTTVELSAANRRMLYIPGGLAHGFQTLTDGSEVFYQMSTAHVPQAARGVRWDDPAFGIDWPPAERIISERDRALPDFTGAVR